MRHGHARTDVRPGAPSGSGLGARTVLRLLAEYGIPTRIIAGIWGIDEKDLDVRVENNTLTVHGERKFEKEEKEENYRRVERQYGSFTRSFNLPNTVDAENISADYDRGVLKVQLAKKAEAKPKQIKVNVGSAKAIEGKEAKGAGRAA